MGTHEFARRLHFPPVDLEQPIRRGATAPNLGKRRGQIGMTGKRAAAGVEFFLYGIAQRCPERTQRLRGYVEKMTMAQQPFESTRAACYVASGRGADFGFEEICETR